MVPGRPKINNYACQTVAPPGLNGRRGYQPRGKCLGGSSAIDAMLYIRGQREDYDGWPQQGCAGCSFDEVLPYFKRAEGNERGACDSHGADGPLLRHICIRCRTAATCTQIIRALIATPFAEGAGFQVSAPQPVSG